MFNYSEEHAAYLRTIRKQKFWIHFFRIFLLLLFLIFWEVSANFGWLNPFLYSSPSRIFITLFSLDSSLFHHIGITLYEVLLSFLASSFLSIVCASFLWRFPFLAKVLDPFFTIFNSLPKVALGPLIIIWIGANLSSICFMAFLISFFTTTITIYQQFSSVPSSYLLLMQSMKAKKYQIFWNVIFPSSLDSILTALKINAAMCFIGVIMGEFLVSKKGIGYLIQYGSQVFRLDLVISGILLLGILSYLFYLLIDFIQHFIHKKRGN